jgi:hypothetical protein
MTILYTDTRNQHRIECPEIAPLIIDICNRYLMIPTWFDIVHIDLRGDIEAVEFYNVIEQSHVAGLGGAGAWKVYELLAEQLPEINHHFRRPPSAPPPTVLSSLN